MSRRKLPILDTDKPSIIRQAFYPRLVAFFGDTGMGKSTIIKNLIRHLTSSKAFDVPVVGSRAEAQNSTSAGVHIYMDPDTFRHERPIVYVGIRSNTVAHEAQPVALIQPDLAEEVVLDRALKTKPQPLSSMPLPWAEHVSKPWRSVVSEKIYPRFLYIFSDVVCYVSGNSRTAEDDMAQLVNWAHDAHDFTTNQGVKPGLLYIINQDNHSNLEDWRNVEYATKCVLEKLRKSKRFATEQELWSSRGRKVTTADQLLRCYYSSLKVVFIPQFLPKDPICEADDLWKQYRLLYREVNGLSWSSSEHRKEARVLFNLETLSRHSIGVLRQLAVDPTSSVDLRKIAEPAQTYPCGFNGHVLNILAQFQETAPKNHKTSEQTLGAEEALIRKVFKYVAICIAREIKRTASDRSSETGQIEYYTQKWRLVLEDFSRTRCRCEKMYYGQRCTNYRLFHVKGHQFNRKGRENILEGPFVSRFLDALDPLQDEFATKLPHFLRESVTTVELTRDLWYNAKSCDAGRIFSNRTCLACLSRTPAHTLPCNHSICDPCAGTFNSHDRREEQSITIPRCPLGCEWPSLPSWTIRRKAPEAGVRILSLDGGGVRGIIQLEILQSIAARVGHNIPIQELFDVIVGTGTSGIISLGIFKKEWSIHDAKGRFHTLMKAAFSKRSLLKLLWPIPGGSAGAQIMLNYLYRSEELESALQAAFGDEETLFGCPTINKQAPNQVAIIATGEEDGKSFLLTNYNREWLMSDNESNNLRREERPKEELKIWEVARCSSAAPTYFEHYHHPATNRIYRDGTVDSFNPVLFADRERQLLWPDISENSRDILVSIGAGYSSDWNGDAEQDSAAPKALKPLEQIGLVARLATLRLVQQNTSSCQEKWTMFKRSVADDSKSLQNCHRVNVPFGRGQILCKLDEVSKLDAMQTEALAFLHQTSKSLDPSVQAHTSAKLEKITRQLIAALFYFQVRDAYDLNEYKYHCTGRLYCRLSTSLTQQMASLINTGKPQFHVFEEENPVGEKIIFGNRGWEYKDFSISANFDALIYAKKGVSIKVTFDGWDGQWEDISGFPRKFKRRGRL
ncbi:FabD/lysophospholipase-like protein [Stipitochalara longipes BDJ]|nr:FabD/lysophospholipase-like protein [Stipitochalara longipes BDJ]